MDTPAPAQASATPAVHVPLLAPDGTPRLVPAEQADAALAGGGTVALAAPDGSVRSVPREQLQQALAAGGQPVVPVLDPHGVARWVPQSEVGAAVAAGGKLDVPNVPNATVAAYHPGLLARLRATVANSAVGHSLQSELPRVANALGLQPTETASSPTYQSDAGQLVAPQYLVPADAHGAVANVARGALTAAGGFTTPGNVLLAAAPGAEALGLGEAGARAMARLASAGFAGLSVVNIAKESPRLLGMIRAGDSEGAEQLLGQLGVTAGAGALAAAHAAEAIGGGTAGEPAPEAGPTPPEGGEPVPNATGEPAQPAPPPAPAPSAAPSAPAPPPRSTAAPVGDVGRTEPNLALNLNLDRLSTSDDVRSAIASYAANHAEDFSEQRRGVVPLKTTQAVAKQMVTDGLIAPEHVANVTRGTAWNAEQLNAARTVMLSAGNVAKRAAEAYQSDPSDANLADVQAAISRFGAVQKSVSGLTAEAGRALGSLRIAARAVRSRSNFETALNALGGRELGAKAAADLAAIPEGDTEGLAKFLRSQDKWTLPQKVQAWWTASLLSSPRTMVAKLVGDATMAALDAPVRLARGGADAVLSALNSDRPRQYFASEAVPALAGTLHGMGEGLGKFLFVLRTGLNAAPGREVGAEVETPPRELFGGGANPMNWGPRFLRAATAGMESVASQAELEAGALRTAMQKGLRGADARADAAQTLASPPDALVQTAAEFARRQTFTNGSAFLAKVQTALDHPDVAGLKPLRFIVPFLRVPYNIAARGLELTPAGLAAGLAKGDADLMARGLIGSAVLGYSAHLAANGYLTGAAPQSPADRAAFYAEGKQPYSVRIGTDWVSYERNFGVLGLPLAAGAAFKDKFDHQGVSAAPDAITRAAFELGQMFEHLPMVEGINALSQALADPARFGQQFVSNVAEGFVPFSAGLRAAARLQDPTERDAQGVYTRIVSGLPFAQESLPARVDPLGRTEVNRSAQGIANAILPSPVASTAPLGLVDAELARLGVYPGPEGGAVVLGNQHVKLTPAQTQARQQAVGAAIRRAAQAVVMSPGYAGLTDESRRDLLQRDTERARRAASKEYDAGLRAFAQRSTSRPVAMPEFHPGVDSASWPISPTKS